MPETPPTAAAPYGYAPIKKKSWAREIAAVVGLWVIALVTFTFIGFSDSKISVLTPIIMGFLSPVFLACLGVFVHKSAQDHIDKRAGKT